MMVTFTPEGRKSKRCIKLDQNIARIDRVRRGEERNLDIEWAKEWDRESELGKWERLGGGERERERKEMENSVNGADFLFEVRSAILKDRLSTMVTAWSQQDRCVSQKKVTQEMKQRRKKISEKTFQFNNLYVVNRFRNPVTILALPKMAGTQCTEFVTHDLSNTLQSLIFTMD